MAIIVNNKLMEPFITYKGDSFDTWVGIPLEKMLTQMDKYNVPQVYLLQFSIETIIFKPSPVLVSLGDNLKFVNSGPEAFKEKIDKDMNENVFPSVIVSDYNTSLPKIILGHGMICYTPYYLIVSKDFKELLKNKTIGSVIMYADKTRDEFIIKFGDSDGNELDLQTVIFINSFLLNPLKLPFKNFAKSINKDYIPLIKNIAESSNRLVFDEKDSLNDIYKHIQDEQEYNHKIDDNLSITIYKDFVKQKPSSIIIFYNITKNEEINKNIISVCLQLKFDAFKIQNIIFYRYIEYKPDLKEIQDGSTVSE